METFGKKNEKRMKKQKQSKDFLEGYWFGRKKFNLEVLEILDKECKLQFRIDNEIEYLMVKDLLKAKAKIKKLVK